MESSSEDSFLWTDASNDTPDMDVESETVLCKRDCESGASYETEIQKSHKKKSKKRKVSETSSCSQPDKKRIKSEPESDIEAIKMKKLRKNKTIENISNEDCAMHDDYLKIKVKQEQASLLEEHIVKSKKKKKHRNSISDFNDTNHSLSAIDMDKNGIGNYLDMRVKQEQESLVKLEGQKSKRKKKHTSLNLDNDNRNEAQSVEEPIGNEIEDYLNIRVKQEQASLAMQDVIKPKKKKKHKISVAGTDTEEAETQSATFENNKSNPGQENDMEYTVIEDKFIAEETVINKPKKKKRKRDNESIDRSDDADKSRKHENIEVNSNDYHYENSDIDISVQPNDFNSNNVISSTIINHSTIADIITNKNSHKQNNITENLLGNEIELHRTTKISDRIRFEDDESSSHQELIINKQSPKIKAFLQAHPHLQVVSPKTQCNTTISTDNEIWILRCPREIDHKKLKNSNFSLEGKCKLKIDGQTYDGIPNDDITKITHITYQHGDALIMNFPVNNSINFRKRIPKAHFTENTNVVDDQTNFIPLPETKCRHPFFGANYKKSIKIPAIVAARLEEAKDRNAEAYENNESTKKKKNKKDKKKSKEIKMEEEDCKPICKPSKKSRKRKHSEETEPSSKKTKRSKHDPHSAEVWESEKAIEENLFNF